MVQCRVMLLYESTTTTIHRSFIYWMGRWQKVTAESCLYELQVYRIYDQILKDRRTTSLFLSFTWILIQVETNVSGEEAHRKAEFWINIWYNKNQSNLRISNVLRCKKNNCSTYEVLICHLNCQNAYSTVLTGGAP